MSKQLRQIFQISRSNYLINVVRPQNLSNRHIYMDEGNSYLRVQVQQTLTGMIFSQAN